MQVGKLRHRIALQRKQQPIARDQYGGELPWVWETYAEVWADIGAERGREGLVLNALRDELNTRFMIRFREDVVAAHRIVVKHTGAVYDITEVMDVPGTRRALMLRARTGVSNG